MISTKGVIRKYQLFISYISYLYQLFDCRTRPTLTLNDMLNKINYMLKIIPLHPNLATNARVNFKSRSLLITH